MILYTYAIWQENLKIFRIMNVFDDNPNTCEKLSKNNIRTLYFRSIYGKKVSQNDYLKEVHNWGNVYRCLKMLNID